MPDCSSIQKSLAWCQGKPELPGVKRRIYYVSKYDILQWPVLQHDANGRLLSASYTGNFVLRADVKWKYIDILPDKSQLTSEPQGEYPSQTQLNKLLAVHPGVDLDASEASAYLNNNDNVFLVEDMRGAIRVVGSDKWQTKTTVNQDLGQGATGTTSTTINVEATDECPAPFYTGTIETDEGSFSGNSSGSSSSSSGSNSGSNSGGSSSGSTPVYNNVVYINGTAHTVGDSSGDSRNSISITGNLTSLKFTGTNMSYISYQAEGGTETEIATNNSGTEAVWSGNIIAPSVVTIYKSEGTSESPRDVTWMTITLVFDSNSSPTNDDDGN